MQIVWIIPDHLSAEATYYFVFEIPGIELQFLLVTIADVSYNRSQLCCTKIPSVALAARVVASKFHSSDQGSCYGHRQGL